MLSLKNFIDLEADDFTKLNDVIIDKGLDNVNDLTSYDYELKNGIWCMTAKSEEIFCLWVFDDDHECIDFVVVAEFDDDDDENLEEDYIPTWELYSEQDLIEAEKYDDEKGAWELW